MVALRGRAANEDELELDGRSLLQALWEQPRGFSRNRHFEALANPHARRALREVRMCRALLRDFRRQGALGVCVTRIVLDEEHRASVELKLGRIHARRVVLLSLEAFGLLLAQPDAEVLRARLLAQPPWPGGKLPPALERVLKPQV